MSPALSLAMPVRNGERFIEAAVGSLLAQSFTDYELLIVDNASTDATQQICERLTRSDPRIRYFRNKADIGAGANFNRGVELASGVLFKWCAHDDLISPDYLARCIAALAARPSAVTAYGRLLGIDESGALTGYIEDPLPAVENIAAARRFDMVTRRQGLDAAIFGLHRRSALLATSLHLPYYGSDCALLSELALLGPFVHVPEAVLFSREHPTRSVNLTCADRLAWQAAAGAKPNAREFSSRIRHLYAIAFRHRATAPFTATAVALTIWLMHPVRLGRVALEAVGSVSPSLRAKLRAAGLAILSRFGGRSARRGRQDA
ncbi:MAG: glycosyltransferase family 2 protein [Bauldia sp.]|nr:glycosyltransferase family 2 protein [Bauldia sp.]